MGCCFSVNPTSDSDGDESESGPAIGIPSELKGDQVKVTSDLTITGSGSALASAPIEQDAAYWEVRIDNPGTIRVGVSRKLNQTELKKCLSMEGGANPRYWCFGANEVKQGDVIGVAFGQSDLPNLSFYVNGSSVPTHDVRKIGGLVYPVFSLEDGAAMTVIFDQHQFKHQPPPSFKPLMVVRSIL